MDFPFFLRCQQHSPESEHEDNRDYQVSHTNKLSQRVVRRKCADFPRSHRDLFRNVARLAERRANGENET